MCSLWKKIIMGVLLMGIMVALSGCGNENQKEQAEKLLEEKYGQKFVVTRSISHGSLFDNTYKIEACPKDIENLIFMAEVSDKGTELSDEYVSVCVCNKIEKEITENLKSLDGTFYVNVESVSKTIKSNDYNMSIDRYLEIKKMFPLQYILFMHLV